MAKVRSRRWSRACAEGVPQETMRAASRRTWRNHDFMLFRPNSEELQVILVGIQRECEGRNGGRIETVSVQRTQCSSQLMPSKCAATYSIKSRAAAWAIPYRWV